MGGAGGEVAVRRDAVESTLELRQRVLRPHQHPSDLVFPGDTDPDTTHLVAVTPEGLVVGTATVMREAPPAIPGGAAPWSAAEPAWRLRGMATDEPWRGRGVGGRLLVAAAEHVRTHGGGLLWCNARGRARPFYERAGLRVVGDAWDDPLIGPHVRMWRRV